SEARHICAYLDEKSGKRTVAPYGDWQAVSAEAQSLAFLDVVTVWSREMRRPEEERSRSLLEVADIQVRRGLAHLNSTVKAPAGAPPISFDALCVVAALGMMQFYALAPDWRQSYPALAAWSDAYDTIASVADSAPSQDALRPLAP
ncbi:MAG: hypothetical protein ABJD17_15395, partial [Nisaea sp.]